MKSKVDKLDVDKLLPVPVDLSKLSDVVNDKNENKIKNAEDEIPDITSLATKTSLNATINEAKGEIPNIINWATFASHNIKINEVKGKIPNITNLVTTSFLLLLKIK